jgi:D-psicose/D-tagatose/L-ribulose 3-epimerase
MHLSMHNWMRDEPIATLARRLAAFGYKSVELGGRSGLKSSEVKATLRDSKIRCWGIVTLMAPSQNLISVNASERQMAIDYAKECVTLAKVLDGEVVTVLPAPSGKLEPDEDPDTEWAWAVEGMREIYGHAQQEGIRLAIEALNRYETYFIRRADQALALASAVGKTCGVALDTFHMNVEDANPFEAIVAAGARLVDFHVADTNRMACGLGRWDWPQTIAALRKNGYEGALVVESHPPPFRAPTMWFPATPEMDLRGEVLSEKAYAAETERSAKTLLPLLSA